MGVESLVIADVETGTSSARDEVPTESRSNISPRLARAALARVAGRALANVDIAPDVA
jgi:hypothetical protein